MHAVVSGAEERDFAQPHPAFAIAFPRIRLML
jgi:hypothetical protein